MQREVELSDHQVASIWSPSARTSLERGLRQERSSNAGVRLDCNAKHVMRCDDTRQVNRPTATGIRARARYRPPVPQVELGAKPAEWELFGDSAAVRPRHGQVNGRRHVNLRPTMRTTAQQHRALPWRLQAQLSRRHAGRQRPAAKRQTGRAEKPGRPAGRPRRPGRNAGTAQAEILTHTPNRPGPVQARGGVL